MNFIPAKRRKPVTNGSQRILNTGQSGCVTNVPRIQKEQKSMGENTWPSDYLMLLFRLIHNIGVTIRQTLRGRKKPNSKLYYLGCTPEYFVNYMESQFLDGMTLENNGVAKLGGEPKWHSDHIIPKSYFGNLSILSDEDLDITLRTCHNWRNFQPMWGKRNIGKSAKTCVESLRRLMVFLDTAPPVSKTDERIVATLREMAQTLLKEATQELPEAA
jgi:hypothetical protein